MDIVIKADGWGAIVIENKINAEEQPKQIETYADYLKKYNKFVLLYLTLDGQASKEAGVFEGNYRRISYKDHILPWLDKCLRETYQFVNINQALQQYRQVVQQVTGGITLEKEFMEKVKELVKQHPAIIKHYQNIGNAIEELRNNAYSNYWEAIGKNSNADVVEINKMGRDLWPAFVAKEIRNHYLKNYKPFEKVDIYQYTYVYFNRFPYGNGNITLDVSCDELISSSEANIQVSSYNKDKVNDVSVVKDLLKNLDLINDFKPDGVRYIKSFKFPSEVNALFTFLNELLQKLRSVKSV